EEYCTITGCQHRCPFCGNKCIYPDSDHTNHSSNQHYLVGYGGCHVIKSREISLQKCLSAQNFNTPWTEESLSILDYLKKTNPGWVYEFEKNKNVGEVHLTDDEKRTLLIVKPI